MSSVSGILNSAEIGFLTDLFLAFLGLDRDGLGYRRIKHAVMLLATVRDDVDLVYAELAEVEETTADVIKADITDTLNGLPSPPDELFNKAYCDDGFEFMPAHESPSDYIAALGKTFLYLLETNYPEYRSIIPTDI